MPAAPDARRYSDAAARNTAPILAALGPWLSQRAGAALEIGSGGGQHILALAEAAPQLSWTPSDPDPAARASVDAWAAHARAQGRPSLNVRPAVAIDAAAADWPADWAADGAAARTDEGPDAPAALAVIFAANVIHIAPWAVAEGLFAGAGRWLARDGGLALYGPFSDGGVHTAPSNAAFDAALRRRDPRWGVRDLTELDALAAGAGLYRAETLALPANNRILLYERSL